MSAPEVLALLRERHLTIAAGESLTGGLVVASLIDVPGASDVVRGGAVAYQRQIKSSLLGVPPELIAARGTVDAGVALELARGAARVFGADVGVGTTGVAGPGVHEGKPAGTAYVAAVLGSDDADPLVVALNLAGDRAQVRLACVRSALSVVRARLES
jgi:nicotinamide-nucleotide amidase